MKTSTMAKGIAIVALAMATGLFGAAAIQAQGGQAPSSNQGQGGGQGAANGQQGQGRGRGPTIDPAEENAYKAFNAAASDDAKITAGEDFEQKYPSSRYVEVVQATLVNLYYNKQAWDKFYPEADKVLAKDPDNVPVLT